MRGIQKEISRRPKNTNQYLYVRSIGLGCWGTCPTAREGSEWLSHKIPGAELWTSSAHTAWCCCLRWIVCSSEPFLGTKNGIIAGREVWTLWRVTENLPLEFMLAFSHVTLLRWAVNFRALVGTTLCYTHNNIVTGLHIPACFFFNASDSFLFYCPLYYS